MRVPADRRWTLLSVILLTTCLALPASPVVAQEEQASGPTAQLKRITLSPEQVVLAGARSSQGLRVTGEYADGTLRDVTSQCEFGTSDGAVADVSKEGTILPKANGAATITAKLRDLTASAPLSVARFEDNSYNFRNDVLPVLSRLTCNQMGCHGSPKGKKRLHLSLFSANPHKDFLQITDKKKKLLDPAQPDRSWLLLKATCEEDHGGADLTAEGDPEYDLLVDWIKQQSPEGGADDPELVRVRVFPEQRHMLPGDEQRLLVEAYYSDGTMRDVTTLSSFKSNEEAVAKVDETGVVQGTGYGEAVFMIAYGGRLATSRVTSSQPATVPFPEVPTNNRVDELVLDKLRELNVIPSDLCTDAEFLRRVYLDVVGVLPTAEEARAFLSDTGPDKRSRLIDALLERPEYADFYAVKWGDVLQINRNNPSRLQDKGMWAYYRWLWDALDQNMPMDQFVHQLLTARGSAYRNGPANFFRVGEGPQGMAEHASTAFLGVRLDCAHCHNHPFEQFTLIDNLGMAAFFTKVRIKRSQEQDEEIIYVADSGSIRNPETNKSASPKFLAGKHLAAAELAARAQADAEASSAAATAKSAANVLAAAVAKAKAAKTAGGQRVVEKDKAVKQAAATAATAKAAANKAAADLVAAEKQAAAAAAADKEAAGKEAADKLLAERRAVAKATAERAVAAKAQADKAAQEKAAVATAAVAADAANKAAVDKATAEKVAADKSLADKTAAAKQAAAAVVAAESPGDPRAVLAAWITAPDNPYFAKHMVNRVWTWLLGRGVIDEPDDFRSTNPASNRELLDYLAGEFVRTDYDMKGMFRHILNSRTYQLSAQPHQWNKHDRIHYSHYHLKRLTAEQLATAISQVTGVHEKYPGLPLGTRATQLPDVSMRSEFLDLFGRPKRATPVESERTCDTHIGQSLQMISSEYVARKLRDNGGRAAQLAASEKTAAAVVDELYLVALSRFPTDAERQVILAEPIAADQRREKFEDLAWVLMNTKEFLFNH
ncbi:MAG: DUF1549 and DUF1553 domain-containing protein [Pirellulaceae bacterium]|nr:DUF1549 and DUF1553 domain-containing protein [Pirellulaceae bacterium]